MAKFEKVDLNILLEGMTNIGHIVHGRKHDFLPSYIGSVEVVDGVIHYGDGDYDYETSLYLAIQLSNGPIVGVKDDGTIFALTNKRVQYDIHWGYYPDGFDKGMATKRPCPKGLLPEFMIPAGCSMGYIPIELDELPF